MHPFPLLVRKIIARRLQASRLVLRYATDSHGPLPDSRQSARPLTAVPVSTGSPVVKLRLSCELRIIPASVLHRYA